MEQSPMLKALIGMARDCIRADKPLQFFVVRTKDEFYCICPMFRNSDDKNRFCDVLLLMIASGEVEEVGYAFEAWKKAVPEADKETLERIHQHGVVAEPDRQECVVFYAETPTSGNAPMLMAPLHRTDAGVSIGDLEEMPTAEGRFTDFFRKAKYYRREVIRLEKLIRGWRKFNPENN